MKDYSKYDLSDIIERSTHYQSDENFMSSLFILNSKNVVSAVVSAVLVSVLSYLSNLASLTDLNWHVVGGLALATFATSLLKAFGTTSDGKFAGLVKVY